MQQICKPYLEMSKPAVCSWTFYIGNKGISKAVFKNMKYMSFYIDQGISKVVLNDFDSRIK